MKPISRGLKKLLIFTALMSLLSISYYLYALLPYPPVEENETLLSEIGEFFGEVGLWVLLFIYARTFLKLLMGKGAISKRLLPDYSPQFEPTLFNNLISFLDRTHIYFGMIAVAVIMLHCSGQLIPDDKLRISS